MPQYGPLSFWDEANQPGGGFGLGTGVSRLAPSAPAFVPPAPVGQQGLGSASGPGQTGVIDVPNPFEGPQGAAIRALRQAGYNPGSFHPAVRAVLAKAGALAKELALTLGDNPEMAGSAESLLDAFRGMVQSAVTGGKV